MSWTKDQRPPAGDTVVERITRAVTHSITPPSEILLGNKEWLELDAHVGGWESAKVSNGSRFFMGLRIIRTPAGHGMLVK